MRFARTALLREAGFDVHEATTGRQALTLVERLRPDVVLLDVNLPDMSGIDVCRQIRSDYRWEGVRVAQTSATFTTPLDQLHGLELGGADVYLVEPVDKQMLLSLIRRLAARSNERDGQGA
ncbi:MAG: response regulator transcription factor [Vicinamibacterales bacterium]